MRVVSWSLNTGPPIEDKQELRVHWAECPWIMWYYPQIGTIEPAEAREKGCWRRYHVISELVMKKKVRILRRVKNGYYPKITLELDKKETKNSRTKTIEKRSLLSCQQDTIRWLFEEDQTEIMSSGTSGVDQYHTVPCNRRDNDVISGRTRNWRLVPRDC